MRRRQRGRVADGACSSLAVEWPDPERAVTIRSQSDGCACVHETGWLWPLRMAKHMHEWATSGGAERRNTAAYEHAISLGAFRTVLGVGVDEAGSISWRSCTRRLVNLAAQRLVGPSAHRPSGRGPGSGFALERRIAPPTTKPSWGSDAQAELMRIPAFCHTSVRKKSYYEKHVPCPGV